MISSGLRYVVMTLYTPSSKEKWEKSKVNSMLSNSEREVSDFSGWEINQTEENENSKVAYW